MTTDARLTERFAPVFAEIAAGALDREADRVLPAEAVELLRESGFTRIRVPEQYGGLGATVPQFVRQLIALAEADSNLPQLLRGHFAFVESRLSHPEAAVRERWLRAVAAGEIIGNAQSENGSSSFWTNTTAVTPDGDGWSLSGRKFYSTGSLFADWIHTSAAVDADRTANVLVPSGAPGVERIDDWDGFGQRLTGSGTTVFDGVPVPDEDVEIHPNGEFSGTYLLAVLQLNHLATLAGIGQAAVRDAVAFVRQRSRNLINPRYPRPAADPQIQQVVGRIASASFAATATTLAAADAVGEIADAVVAGTATAELFDAADVAVFSAQTAVADLVLGAATELFEVGGASAVTDRFGLDRHWRNARTLASHNPAIYRQTLVGDYLLNGRPPSSWAADSWAAVRESEAVGAGVPATAKEGDR
ncbi:acyl-CoA dehydrogenase family protein [Gordonia sp. PP30]|uniref:acyl-CoA dehydrogenase family protein n=1 Tax=Gordonia sp. PP30 TaxID=2935861 RepID=UPI001FFE3E05|nr:acyl-CoA dehydrogenase family protein [Gordonia sp. PP30]UQE74775.1 acyl-CoA dehydrogenase family protein [Gordonia sp. PP30]